MKLIKAKLIHYLKNIKNKNIEYFVFKFSRPFKEWTNFFTLFSKEFIKY